jgi:hypothetical protein
LAYYVEWHMRQAWTALLYADEELEADQDERDPVKPARASESAQRKKQEHTTAAGWPAHSFGSLLAHLATRVRNTHEVMRDASSATFQQVTEPDAIQTEALRLLSL